MPTARLLRVLMPSGHTLKADSNRVLSDLQSLHRRSVPAPKYVVQANNKTITAVRLTGSRTVPLIESARRGGRTPCFSSLTPGSGRSPLLLLHAGARAAKGRGEEGRTAGCPKIIDRSCWLPFSFFGGPNEFDVLVPPQEGEHKGRLISLSSPPPSEEQVKPFPRFEFEFSVFMTLYFSLPGTTVSPCDGFVQSRQRRVQLARTQAPRLGRYRSCVNGEKREGGG
ncbi:unnamed protein product [Ectocarpus sp. 6 AP-2014]